jgi:flagellar motor component MotA
MDETKGSDQVSSLIQQAIAGLQAGQNPDEVVGILQQALTAQSGEEKAEAPEGQPEQSAEDEIKGIYAKNKFGK